MQLFRIQNIFILTSAISYAFYIHHIPKYGSYCRRLTPSKSPDSESITSLIDNASRRLSERFWSIDMQTMMSMDKILSLYREERIDASCFHGVDGYGYGDIGREKLDLIVAKLMGAEAAVVRLQFFSGTHAISSALFGALRPGDNILCVSGHPYDTLEEVIGLRDGHQTGSRIGSLADWGIGYKNYGSHTFMICCL